MSIIEKKQVDFLQAIASLLFQKIEPNTQFKNKRIKEWCDNLPTPELSNNGSADVSALEIINTIHEDLVRIDHVNTTKGTVWPISINKKFENKCIELKNKIDESNVDESIINLVYYHNAKLFRSRRKYDKAIGEIRKASGILASKISVHPTYLPKYSRNIILNKGEESELLRLNGSIDEAISSAEEMLEDIENHSANEGFVSLDTRKGFCSAKAWALYYLCEAHLSVEDWDNKDAIEHRRWSFSEAFGGEFYKQWNIPTLIKAMNTQVWEERYPHYHNDIADIVFVGTSQNKMQKISRQASVYFGRVAIKPLAPVATISLVAALSLSPLASNSKNPEIQRQPAKAPIVLLEETINEIKKDPQFSDIKDDVINEVKEEVTAQIIRLEQLENRDEEIDKILEMVEDKYEMPKVHEIMSLAMTGNEQGVGVA